MAFLDVIIIGAGFSGLHTLHKLRQSGFNAKIYEAGGYLGGTWWWNRYPGARVDIETPIYQLSNPDVWEDFDFSQRYPGQEELQKYFAHVDAKLGLSKDIVFNTRLLSAKFNAVNNIWSLKMSSGDCVSCRYLILCTGFASIRYTPSIPGLDRFQGTVCHSANWPEYLNANDFTEKRIAVIGTGSSGVQIIQELGPHVQHLTVYQRTPNMALPMRQCEKKDDGMSWAFPKKSEYPKMFLNARNTFSGIRMDFARVKWDTFTAEERHQFYEELWTYGGFSFWLGNYMEVVLSQEANDEAYAFLATKIRKRVHDPVKKDLLAPLTPPHPWGTKNPSLESRYYEIFNQDNVDLININESPILEITEVGIRTKEGIVELDAIIFATGFDNSASVLSIDIKNAMGKSMKEHWDGGISSYLGMCTHEFPNLFWTYGLHSPASFANGPLLGEVQGDWIVELLCELKTQGRISIEVEKSAEEKWTKRLLEIWEATLAPLTNSWYQGVNIPGRKKQPLYYFGGVPAYIEAMRQSQINGYQGFTLS